MIEDREKNLSKVQQQRKQIQSEIQTMRDKINKHLDNIEQKILKDLRDTENGVNSEIQRIHTKLIDYSKTVEELAVNMSSIKKYASNLQIFVGMKKVATDIENAEKFVVSLVEDGSLHQSDIDIKMDRKISDIFSIEGYGKISRITSSPSVIILTEKNKQAQYLVTASSTKRTIDDINFSSHRKIKIPELNLQSRFTGCTITPSGNIILVDWNYNTVFVLNENESLKFKKRFPCRLVDVCCIDDTTIAISHLCFTTQIEILNISSEQKEIPIRTSNECYGITNEQGRLIYCLKKTGIQSVDVSGDDAFNVVKQPRMSKWNYVTASGDKLYHTNPTTDTVTCYNITGEKIWEYNDKSVLKDIYGVTTDKDANVYVASRGNDSIVVLSSDGKHARRITGKEDGLNQPHGIYLDKTGINLLISCYNGEVHMYNVS